MRASTPFLRALLAVSAIVLVAACSLEVNINLDGDDTVPTVTPEADAPAATLPPAPPAAPETRPRPAPRPLIPPRPLTPPRVETGDAIRDALLRRDATPQLRERPDIDPANGPSFTPFTVAPSILNRQQIITAMTESYPPLLRDAGIGGTVKVYFFIDSDGTVGDVRLDQGSGHPAIDDAALAVASVYRFAPARNQNEAVPVWVSFPITFQVR